MKRVVVHSDGACLGNPGPGGWAALLEYGAVKRELVGGELATTNNRMEMQAALSALTALREPCEVEFHTDSEYLRKGITTWIHGWKATGWKKKIKNQDLWLALDAAAARHRIEWKWVRGHAGHPKNERCDELATAEAARLKRAHTAEERRVALAEFKESACAPQAVGGAPADHTLWQVGDSR